jgi:hypothetical protein
MKTDFIFPKRQVRIEKRCPMQISSGYAKCFKCKYQEAKIIRRALPPELDGLERGIRPDKNVKLNFIS